MNWYEKMFIYVTYAVYLLYIITAIGLSSSTAPQYLHYLNYLRQIYIGITLFVLTNPLKKKIQFNEFHRKIIFASSIFLLLSPFELFFKTFFKKFSLFSL